MAVICMAGYKLKRVEHQEVRQVADVENGFTRVTNELYDALISADLSRNEMKVVHAIIRRTLGFNKSVDRISDTQLTQQTGLSRQAVNFAKNSLIRMSILITKGPKIGLNMVLSDWDIQDCHRKSDSVRETMTKTVRETMTQVSEKPGHTKDNIQKTKENTPLPPRGGQPADAGLPEAANIKKSSKPKTDYQAFADEYNRILGDRLPNCTAMSDKRKRGLLKLLAELKQPTLEYFSAYLQRFSDTAGSFYFGQNDRGWCASIDYLLRPETLIKTREGSLLTDGGHS